MSALKILVVCYGNRCRSPMFQTLLTHEFAKRGVEANIESAGLIDNVGQPASEPAQQCMLARGLDLSTHRNRYISSMDLKSFDFIYVMEEKFVAHLVAAGARIETIEVLNREGGGIANPYERGDEVYRACATQLEEIAIGIAILRDVGHANA